MKMEEEHDTILRYIQLKQYPEGASTKKRSLRRESEKFVLRDGPLYYSSSGTLRQWISSKIKSLQHAILTILVDTLVETKQETRLQPGDVA